MKLISKFGLIMMFMVSLIVGLWNFIVSLSYSIIGITSFIDFLALLDSLFYVIIACYIITYVINKLKLIVNNDKEKNK